MTDPLGLSTAVLLRRVGRDDAAVVASLIEWLGLTAAEAAAALDAAKAAVGTSLLSNEVPPPG